MPGATYLCGGDEECPRHGKFIYFCYECHLEWEADNPNTVKAIRSKNPNRSSLIAARKKDAALRAARLAESTPVQKPGDNP